VEVILLVSLAIGIAVVATDFVVLVADGPAIADVIGYGASMNSCVEATADDAVSDCVWVSYFVASGFDFSSVNVSIVEVTTWIWTCACSSFA
jgi:hypothetical protein